METEIQNICLHNLEIYDEEEEEEERVYIDDEHIDCESNVSNDDYDEELFGDVNLVRLDKDDPIHNIIHNKFMACLADISKNTTTMKIWSDFHCGESRLRCFEIYRKSLKDKYGDDNNVKYAWYATSKEDVTRIMSRGFGAKDLPSYNGLLRDSIDLRPINFLNQSVNSCVIDEDGLMHIMLCRVLIERDDIVTDSNSSEFPSNFDDFNSEVEDNENHSTIPSTKYVIGSTKMNTHILPEYVISFKTRFATNYIAKRVLLKKPNSPWMPFSTLIRALTKLIPSKELNLVNKQLRDFTERKISRVEFIQQLKGLVGVDLLVVIVKLCGARVVRYGKANRNRLL
ncbi:hypothetical protein RND81_10G228000 [Saponaria officinalis]|uniref:Uncharacterized protein n=1 Tax=Saponaria officinalis TaxID=3572 RepID=A0AAW1I5A2_SAPOF